MSQEPKELPFRQYESGFFSQLFIMLKRNTILQFRYLNSTISQTLLAPLLFNLLIFVLQKADHQNQSASIAHPPLGALDGVQRCQGRDVGSPCVSVLYTPNTIQNGVDYKQIMQVFAQKNANRTGYQFQLEATPFTDPTFKPNKIYDIVPVPSADFIYDFTLQNPNTTAWGVTFNQPATATPLNIQYQLWFNATNNANKSDIFGRQVLSFVRGLDEAIISVLNDPSATVTADIDISLKDWPLIPPAQLADSIVQQLGPVFFFCSEMLIFINVLNQIVTEKELKLRHGMEVMGLKPSVYWLSQYMSNSLLVILNALFTTIWGYIFQFQAFKDTNFFVLFVTFFLFGEAMVMFAFAITTVVRRSQVAILIGIFIFIIGLLFESFVFASSFLGYIWWSEKTIDPAGWGVLIFFPFFNFGRMFLDITTLTTGLLDVLTDTYIPGPGFGWGQLYEKIPNSTLPNYGSDGRPNPPPPVFAWYYLIMNVAFYGFILWYLDNIIPNEFGMSKPLYFFLTPEYWGFESKSETKDLNAWQERQMKYSQPDEENEDSDVVAERRKVMDATYFPALKILNLRKVYKSYFSKSENKVAVRNSCFAVEKGKLLGS